MWKLLCSLLKICALSIILSSQAYADDFIEQVTFNAPQPPGAVIIRYGGLRGLFVDELENQMTNWWAETIRLHIPYRSIWDEAEPYETLGNFLNDTRRGGRWWERRWYYSRPPEKGGARHPTVYNHDHVAIDLGLFQINSKFRIKAKEFSFLLHRDGRFYRPSFFKLRIRPSLSLGPPYGVRRAGLSLVLEWHMRRQKTWEFEIYIQYRGDENFVLGGQINLVRW